MLTLQTSQSNSFWLNISSINFLSSFIVYIMVYIGNQKPFFKYIQQQMNQFNFCFALQEGTNFKIYKLKESIPCYSYTSNSALLSITAFIVSHFRKMRPPTISVQTYSTVKFDQNATGYPEAYHPFDEAWSNYLIDLTAKDHAIYYDHTFYIEIPLLQLDESKELGLYFTESFQQFTEDTNQRVNAIFSLPQIGKVNKKIGIVAYRPSATNPLEPSINSPALFLGNLYNNEHWTIFKIGDNELPSIEQLVTFSCIIIPGSPYSVFNLPDYIQTSINNILAAYQANINLRLIGICYGHQLISKCFGATIERKQRAGGIERIVFNSNVIKQYPFFDPIASIPELFLSEHHEDFVTIMPQGFKLIASSNSCELQSFLSHDERVLTFQFHGEYFCHFTKRHEQRLSQFFGSNDMKKFYVAESEDIQKINLEHSRLYLQVLRNFMCL